MRESGLPVPVSDGNLAAHHKIRPYLRISNDSCGKFRLSGMLKADILAPVFSFYCLSVKSKYSIDFCIEREGSAA